MRHAFKILYKIGFVSNLVLAIILTGDRARAQLVDPWNQRVYRPESKDWAPIPPPPNHPTSATTISEAQIDAEMANKGYRVSDITYAGRADPGKPSIPTIYLAPGQWAVAVFPIVGNCEISVSYKMNRSEPDIRANMSLGFPIITPPSNGGDVTIAVADDSPNIGCPFHVKAYRK